MKLSLIIIILFFSILSYTQTIFTPISETLSGIPTSLSYNSSDQSQYKIIDFDNDNDLDIYFGYNRIYENLGNNSFVLYTNDSLIGEYYDWNDFDNDGDLDIIASINDSIAIYKNTLPDSVGFILMKDSSFNIGNYSTGWLNLFNMGRTAVGAANTTNIFPNYYFEFKMFNTDSICGIYSIYNYYPTDYTGYFINEFDMNNDGYLDLPSVHDRSANADTIKSIINNGIDAQNKFTIISDSFPFYGYENNETYICDINNDGYLDKGLSYKVSYDVYRNKIFKNNHNNTFSEQTNTGIIDTLASFQHFFDYNNDGRLDALNSNINDSNKIYTNTGNFNFVENPNISNLDNKFRYASSADFDNDGDLDLLISGYKQNHYGGIYTALYRNDSTPTNSPPTPPTGLYAEMDSTKLFLRWQQATDAETPQATLSYNVMVGTSSKSIDITSPLSDTITGFRRIIELGNAQLNAFYILDKSIFNIGDTIYWSVQTIDNGFGYSPFSEECSTVICNSLTANFDTICNNDSLLWQGDYYSSIGDYYKSYGTSGVCDSSFNLFLQNNPSYSSEQSIDICAQSGGFTWFDSTYYQSTNTIKYLQTTKGCDSVFKLNLGVHNHTTTLWNESICLGDSLLFGNAYVKYNGVYIDSLQTTYGCDSLSWLTLEVNPGDTNVYQSNDSLIAQSNTATFRWWNCDNQSYINYQNNSLFTPLQNGNYAVEITENGCSYLSRCFEVTGLFTDNTNIKNIDISIIPNPTNGIFQLNIENTNSEKITTTIYNSLGNEIHHKTINSNDKNFSFKYNLGNISSGIYIIKIELDNAVVFDRLVVE